MMLKKSYRWLADFSMPAMFLAAFCVIGVSCYKGCQDSARGLPDDTNARKFLYFGVMVKMLGGPK